jgi:hypothetical protein
MNTTTRTTTLLRDLGYLGAVLAWSIVSFSVWVAGVSATASVLVLVVGVLVWIGFAYVMRWTTSVDRRLAAWLRHEPIAAEYRNAAPGLIARIKTITADPQTWREFGWLATGSIAGFALAIVAFTAAGVVLAYVTMPLWYWAINDPHAQYGLTNVGVLTADTLPKALAVSAGGLLLSPLVAHIARGAAAGHSQLVRRVLGDRHPANS